MLSYYQFIDASLRWRHNDRDGVSNHQPRDCLLNRLFRRRLKKTSKLRVSGLCAGNSPGTGEFPAQMASYAENVSIWWRHNAEARWRIYTATNWVIIVAKPSHEPKLTYSQSGHQGQTSVRIASNSRYKIIDAKNIKRHTAHTIVTWHNPKQWIIVHTLFDDDNKTKQYILSTITRELGKLKTCSPIYWIMDN